MKFLVQFIRFRRGEPEAIRTLGVDAADAQGALARVTSRAGTGPWPMNTQAFRVMDDGGRTVLRWMLPGSDAEQAPTSREPAQRGRIKDQPHPVSGVIPDAPTGAAGWLRASHGHLEVGQAIAYAEDGQPETWRGGYQIVGASDPVGGEAQYTIRNADEPHDRTVKEHELREDLGSRTRGR